MTIVAERIPGIWFDRLPMTGHPELEVFLPGGLNFFSLKAKGAKIFQ
jgi:hypothetical protein